MKKKKIPNHSIRRAISLIDNQIKLREEKYKSYRVYKKCDCCMRVYINENVNYCKNCFKYIYHLRKDIIFKYNQKINKILKENVIK